MNRPVKKDCADCKAARKRPEKPKPPAPPPDFCDDEPDETEIIEEEARIDAVFVTVPEAVLPAFDASDKIEGVCRDLDGMVKALKELAGGIGGRMIHPSVLERLREVRKTLWANRATHVCPYCKGDCEVDGCDACKSEGWLTATFFAQAPPEMQAEMKKKGAKNVPI
jgi:hypothetical protein